ncbi:biotin transporter BioY [Salinibius halmophilus]|uniref:biotin transporter BioY n=1 Tax=Salinibius halmophilus TaxID=1853216 RepID=UPI001F358926|nr:biotin transporter BioY [Salinibius halmophilus]
MKALQFKTLDIVQIALFAAIMAALGLIPKIDITATLPITAQSMGVMLAGIIIGKRNGFFAILVFTLLMLAGLPLLAGGRGGLGLLAGGSAGFIIGYPIAAFATGWFYEKFSGLANQFATFLASVLGGIVVLYAIGIPGMILNTGMEPLAATLFMAPFIPGDLIKAVLTTIIVAAIARGLPEQFNRA